MSADHMVLAHNTGRHLKHPDPNCYLCTARLERFGPKPSSQSHASAAALGGNFAAAEPEPKPEPEERWVWVINIDIKDGWYDVIHAFTNQAAADAYLAWEADHVGDHAYAVQVPLQDAWIPPEQGTPAEGGALWL